MCCGGAVGFMCRLGQLVWCVVMMVFGVVLGNACVQWCKRCGVWLWCGLWVKSWCNYCGVVGEVVGVIIAV